MNSRKTSWVYHFISPTPRRRTGYFTETEQAATLSKMQLLYIIFVVALLTKLGKCNSDCHDPSKVPLYRRVDDLQGIGSVKSHNGIMALGSVIRAVPVFSVLHCADKCLRRKHCTHFNYYLKTGSGMVCELLKKVKSHRNISQEVNFYEFSRENFNKEFLSPDDCEDLKSSENLLKIPEANC